MVKATLIIELISKHVTICRKHMLRFVHDKTQFCSDAIFTGQMTQPTALKHWRKPVGQWDRLQSHQKPLHCATGNLHVHGVGCLAQIYSDNAAVLDSGECHVDKAVNRTRSYVRGTIGFLGAADFVEKTPTSWLRQLDRRPLLHSTHNTSTCSSTHSFGCVHYITLH